MFKFSLEAVLKQRRFREEEAARGLAEVTRKIQLEHEKLRLLSERQRVVRQANLLAGENGLPAPEVELARFSEVGLMREPDSLRKTLRELEKNKLSRAQSLQARVKERRVLERLRERHLEEYRREEVRKELHELNEIAVLRSRTPGK
ncbi:MAG: flagellar FliJ family protein [Deltaproteobacteria bacterium]|nr:flagellar FliJ family protein [Deltaproteobacteria bacterium]